MKFKRISTYTLTAIFALLAGCQFIVGDFRHSAVSPGNRIPVKTGGPFSGIYNDDNLILDYTYRLQGPEMTIDGNIEFLGGIPNFGYMKHFHLQVYFLDDNGSVLKRTRIFTAGHMREIGAWRFQRRVQTPTDAAAMAFGYSGTAQSSGGPDEISWDFWHLPN